jgi:hypothetical protein
MRHTRAEVTQRTLAEFEELDRLVRRVGSEDWARLVPRPETHDAWTIKDALVHIVYWKMHTLRVFRRERRPPELRGLEVPALNHLIWEQWRQRPAADVVAWHREVHKAIMQTLAELPEEWFGRRERSQHWPGDLESHSAAHRRKDIEAALE